MTAAAKWTRDGMEYAATVNGCRLEAYRVSGAGWHWACSPGLRGGRAMGYRRTLAEAKAAAVKVATDRGQA